MREVYGVLQEEVYAAVAAAGHPGLRPMHSAILRHLSPDGGRVADLARAAGLAKQSAAYVVEDLIKLGYLRTEPDPEDGRARRVAYTENGHGLLTALTNASAEAEAGLVAKLGQDHLRSLRDTLEAILKLRPSNGHPR